jgi:hypothetical protein
MVRRILLMSLTASMLVGIVACGSSTPSSTSLIQDAQAALNSASSVRISGVLPEKGEKYRVDLAMSRSGDISGTIITPVQDIKITIVAGIAYQYVSKDLFSKLVQAKVEPASLCATICNKYVEDAPSGKYKPFTMASMNNLFSKTMPKVSGSVTLTTFAGQPAYKLTDPNGSEAYIARSGQHYLLGVAVAKEGELTFSEWNRVPTIVAPPASQMATSLGAG